jgi:signal transduction histidine kinase
MAGWTALTVVLYDVPSRRRLPLFAADVLVAAGAVLVTTVVDTTARIDAGAPTLPAAWAAAAVLACAVGGGALAGGVAAAVVAIADVVERGDLTEHTFNGIVLLLLAGVVGGYVTRLALRAERTIDTAARREAATSERERLAREIHDSVLQVLALVARRGAAASGELGDIARMAAEQEAALRALVSTPVLAPDPAGEVDLRSLLVPLGAEAVTVSCPGTEVRLPEPTARALAGATGEALHNVQRHAGAGARAWILVEDEPAQVTVSIRDDGVGFDVNRLAEARRDGRLGVAQSILGRMQAVGGDAQVISTTGAGTEVELRVRR